VAENHIGYGDAQEQTLRDHSATRQGLKRVDAAQMTLAEKNPVVAQLFRLARSPMNLADCLYPAVNAVQAKFHLDTSKG
jgi:hypothetical protein